MEGECGDKHAAEEASREEDESACVVVDHPPSVATIPRPFYRRRPYSREIVE